MEEKSQLSNTTGVGTDKDIDVKQIQLTQGKVALVDDKDYEWLSEWAWYALKNYRTFYVVRKVTGSDGRQATVYMHREIMQTPDGMETDHIDGDGLNNQRSNLRICGRAENACNVWMRSDNTSGHKGVVWHKASGKWRAYIRVNGKQIHLGYHTDIADAARAYSEAALQLHGEYAWLNPIEEN